MSVVLIIDDEESFLVMAERILQRAGYETLCATNCDDGLRLVSEYSPDIVILDDMMPGVSGSELCVQLKSSAQYRGLPVIMHTAGVKLKNEAQVQAIGADAVLIKPSSPQSMVDTVARLLLATSA